jgi:hypothetical protein
MLLTLLVDSSKVLVSLGKVERSSQSCNSAQHHPFNLGKLVSFHEVDALSPSLPGRLSRAGMLLSRTNHRHWVSR